MITNFYFKYPGPLTDPKKKDSLFKKVLDYIELQINQLKNSEPTEINTSISSLWYILKLLIEQKGKLQSKNQLIEFFQNFSSSLHQMDTFSTKLKSESNQSEDQSSFLSSLQTSLLSGNINGSVETSINHKQWEHSLILSYFLNPKSFHEIIAKYAEQNLSHGTLKQFYLLCSGNSNLLFDSTPSFSLYDQISSNLNVWKDNIKLLLSTFSLEQSQFKSSVKQMGDFLAQKQEDNSKFEKEGNLNNSNQSSIFEEISISSNDDLISSLNNSKEVNLSNLPHNPYIEASHFCYLLSGSLTFQQFWNPTADESGNKNFMVGLSSGNANVKNFISSFQRTEILEYSQIILDSLNNDKKNSEKFPIINYTLLYRYYYALLLTDFELFDIATNYITQLKSSLQKIQKFVSSNKQQIPPPQVQFIENLSMKLEELTVRIENFKGKQSSMNSIGKSFLSGLFGKVLNAAIGEVATPTPTPNPQNRQNPPSNNINNKKEPVAKSNSQPVHVPERPIKDFPKVENPKPVINDFPQVENTRAYIPSFPAPSNMNIISNPFDFGSLQHNTTPISNINNETVEQKSSFSSYDPFDPFTSLSQVNSEENKVNNNNNDNTNTNTNASSSPDEYDPFFIPSSTPVKDGDKKDQSNNNSPSTPTPSPNPNAGNTPKGDNNSPGIFGRLISKFWSKKEMDLGEQNTFHFDPVLKKWVNKVSISLFLL